MSHTKRPPRTMFITAALAAVMSMSISACTTAGTPEPKVVPTGPEHTSTVSADDNPLTIEELWNPCSVPQQALIDAGLDPELPDPADWPNFKSCSWGSPQFYDQDIGYFANVLSSKEQYSTQVRVSDVTNRDRIKIADDRWATIADSADRPDEKDRQAFVFWGTSFGSITVIVTLTWTERDEPFRARKRALDLAKAVYQTAPI